MTEIGFVQGQSDNLPKVDAFMMSAFFANNPDFTSAEIKGVKASRSERESYGDNAIGYVQVKRENDMCTVKAKITPEHNVRHKAYNVSAVCDENEESIVSAICEDCAAHLGGCKHVIAFLAWLHRRSEDPPLTSVECYWKKSKLSSVGTTLKFIKARDMGQSSSRTQEQEGDGTFLSKVVMCSKENDCMGVQLTKYYKDTTEIEKLSIHFLINSMPDIKHATPLQFLEYCKTFMKAVVCEKAYKATTEQANSPLWHELRYARITASKAYDVVHCHQLEGTLVESILGASKLHDSQAMKRGRLLESEVFREVEKKMGIKINKCGLRLNQDFPIIGASADGENEIFTIEIKCPSTETTKKRYITRDNNIAAKYKAQVQLQMYFAKKKVAIRYLAHHDFETTKNVDILEIDYDDLYCKNIIEKCMIFWKTAIYPILIKNVT